MKRIFLFLFAILLFSACKENMPEIPCLSCNGTTGPVSPDAKKVLIEEFTGVRCVQCPGGSKAIEDLLLIHGERLIAVSIHAGDFSPPFPNSAYDFRTDDGTQLIDFLGAPDGYPSAVVNRNKFGGNSLQQGQDNWNGYINQALQGDAAVNLDIAKSYNSGSRELSLTLTITVNEDLTGDHSFTLLITESGIVDLQYDADQGLITDYTHKHVLRDVLTQFSGDLITENLTKGAKIEKTFSYTVPEDWVATNCRLIAHLSESGTSKKILQVAEVHLAD